MRLNGTRLSLKRLVKDVVVKNAARILTSFMQSCLISTPSEISTLLSGAAFCSFSRTRLRQSPTQQNKFVLKESLASMKWTLLTEFEVTRTGHFSKRCGPSLQKRPAAAESGWI